MITQNEILGDIYELVNSSPIALLNGEIYLKTRPTDRVTQEDCVISLLPGLSGKFLQDGFLTIKIFYNDINKENTYFEDTARGQILEQLLIDFSYVLLKNNKYSFEISSRQSYTNKVIEYHQHYAILKINILSTI